MSPSGVTVVTASTAGGCRKGRARFEAWTVALPASSPGHVVRAVGKEACRKARPRSAGLKTFCPSPPKISLPKPSPNAPPRAAIHSGTVAGSVRPSRTPVMTPDPSATAPRSSKTHSVTTAPAVAAAITRRAARPKNQNAAATTGPSVATTVHMILGVESGERMCGDGAIRRRGDPPPAPSPSPARRPPPRLTPRPSPGSRRRTRPRRPPPRYRPLPLPSPPPGGGGGGPGSFRWR